MKKSARNPTANQVQSSCLQLANKMHANCKPKIATGNQLFAAALQEIKLQTSCSHHDFS